MFIVKLTHMAARQLQTLQRRPHAVVDKAAQRDLIVKMLSVKATVASTPRHVVPKHNERKSCSGIIIDDQPEDVVLTDCACKRGLQLCSACGYHYCADHIREEWCSYGTTKIAVCEHCITKVELYFEARAEASALELFTFDDVDAIAQSTMFGHLREYYMVVHAVEAQLVREMSLDIERLSVGLPKQYTKSVYIDPEAQRLLEEMQAVHELAMCARLEASLPKVPTQ